jgi:hypothetical protein
MHPKRETAKITESNKYQAKEGDAIPHARDPEARKEIVNAQTAIGLMSKSPGGKEGVKYIRSGLKAKLDELGYDWKKCPHALEVLKK